MNAWRKHVKEVYAANKGKGLSFGECLKLAAKSYKKVGAPAPTKKVGKKSRKRTSKKVGKKGKAKKGKTAKRRRRSRARK